MKSYKDLKNRKIIVIGSPGSGKSFVSTKLHEYFNIPIYYLDRIYWHEDWVNTPQDKFIALQEEILKKDAFIIDGNYLSTIEVRISKASTIIFLDLPKEVCLEAVKQRMGQKRTDFPPFLKEELDDEFVHSIIFFEVESKPTILKLLDKYQDKEIIVLHSREEIDKFLDN